MMQKFGLTVQTQVMSSPDLYTSVLGGKLVALWMSLPGMKKIMPFLEHGLSIIDKVTPGKNPYRKVLHGDREAVLDYLATLKDRPQHMKDLPYLLQEQIRN